MAATTYHLKFQNQPINIKRRRCRETTITTTITPTPTPAILDSSSYSSSATASPAKATACTTRNQCQSRKVNTHIVISPENFRCCSATKPPLQPPVDATDTSQPTSPLLPSSSDLKIHFSPSTMGSYGTTAQDSFPSSLIKFNSALTAGLLKPMSPPPLVDKSRSSPTLFEMMASDADSLPRATNGVAASQDQQNSKHHTNPTLEDKQAQKQQRLMDLLASRSPGNQFNDVGSSDVKLILSSKDGVSVAISLHRKILVVHSRFFALNMNEKWVKQQGSSVPYNVEIADCDDIEVYIETLRLMYCKGLRKKLMKEDVPRVLDILKVSAAIGFDAAAESCLEYLAAAPWAEDEEEQVVSLLSELQLEGVGVGEVLKRVSLDSTPSLENGNGNEQVLLKLLQVVLEGKDEKARREMKVLVTKMLRENPSQNDLRKESLYFACDGCLKLLSRHFLNAAQGDVRDVGQIARQADNLHWLLDILIDRQFGEDFLNIWALPFELSEAHPKVSPVHRYEVSRVSARFFVGIGKKQILASKDARCLLLKTWLVPFYEDFGWMRRASGGLDRHLIEEGLSSTISTLPMASQQEIFVSWFNRFLNGGDDCPNIQRGFEVWWRRAFRRRNGEVERPPLMRVVSGTVEKSCT